MKNIIYTFIFITGILLAISVGNSYAQTNKFYVGPEIAYGTNEGSGFGIGANGYYTITKNIRAGIDFIYYLGSPEHVTFWELNFNGQYHFDTNGKISPYVLAGLNISSFSTDIDMPDVNVPGGSINVDSPSSSEIGLNIGAGAEYPVSFGAIFAEAKYILSNYDQLVISAGARFGF